MFRFITAFHIKQNLTRHHKIHVVYYSSSADVCVCRAFSILFGFHCRRRIAMLKGFVEENGLKEFLCGVDVVVMGWISASNIFQKVKLHPIMPHRRCAATSNMNIIETFNSIVWNECAMMHARGKHHTIRTNDE